MTPSAALRKNEFIGGGLGLSVQSKQQALFLSLTNLCGLVRKRSERGTRNLREPNPTSVMGRGATCPSAFPSIYWNALQRFPRAAIVKYHSPGSLNTEICCLAVMEAGSQGASRLIPSEAVRKNLCLASDLASGGC